MPSRTAEHSATVYVAVNTSSVTVDCTTHASGPRFGYGTSTARSPQGARAILVTSTAAGTTVEVTRLDGTQVVLTRNATAGVEYPCQIKKVLPATSVTSYTLLW